MLLEIWIGGTVMMLVSGGLVYLRGLRMSKAEAALSLRDEFMIENLRETDRLMRWRYWAKARIARSRQRKSGGIS